MSRQQVLSAVMFRPPRWNFAQVCGWCLTPWCESTECIAKHEASWWAPCLDCVGGADDYIGGCPCFNGITEASSQVQAERLVREYLRELERVARRRAREVRHAA